MTNTEQILNEILNRLINIEKRITIIEDNLVNNNQLSENIEENLLKIHKSTKNMDEHIDFVENVYSVVKNPFTSVLKYYYSKNDENLLKIQGLNQRSIKNE
jgi:chromosome segregation ATPase